jgi:hypothetical protein
MPDAPPNAQAVTARRSRLPAPSSQVCSVFIARSRAKGLTVLMR